ncbi:MAG: FecR domain-containing protein [Candidatus Eremiobacteraeota bacterium]|nr:FecR domain-containing protein [Candidatus Eremiobacteraeota bacterium]
MGQNLYGVAGFALLLVLSVSPVGRADLDQTVHVVETNSHVLIKPSGSPDFYPKAQSALERGDQLKTDKTGIAQAQIGGNASGAMVAYIGPASEVEVGELLEKANRQLQLRQGRVRAYRKYRDQPGFRITTPNASLTARGTEWLVQHSPSPQGVASSDLVQAEVSTHDLGCRTGETRVAILHGSVADAQGNSVGAGHTLVVAGDGSAERDPDAFHFTKQPRRGRATLAINGREVEVEYHTGLQDASSSRDIERGSYSSGERTQNNELLNPQGQPHTHTSPPPGPYSPPIP